MLHYLYYKLYQATRKGSLNDIAPFVAAMYFGGLIAINIFVIIGFLAKLNLIPFLYSSANQDGLSVFIGIFISSIYFLYKKRYKKILKKHSNETNKQRIKGNIIVSLYIAISFISIFAVAFFKSGKL